MGSPFTRGIHYRGSNLTIEYELVCLVNYFFYCYCYSVLFLETKKEFGKAIKKSAECRIFVKKERDFGFRTPPAPPFRPCDTGRNSTFLIRKQMVRNVKKQTKINIIVSLQLKVKFHLR